MTTFTEGQRVKVVSDLIRGGTGHHINETGTIRLENNVHNGHDWYYVVEMDCEWECGGTYYYEEGELETI